MIRYRRFMIGIICLLLVCFSACAEVEQPADAGLMAANTPAPQTVLEEDAILRSPDKAADPRDYAAVTTATQLPDTKNPPSASETRLSFVAVGDNIIHSAIIEDGKNHAKDGKEYDFTYIYTHVRDVIAAADVAFVNQETPMGGKELGFTGYPNFNGPQEMGDALVDVGFDIVCIATNHMADYRDKGLAGSIAYWKKQPVTLIGGFENKEDFETVRVHEEKGVKIALLAYTYGTNGMSVSTEGGLVIPYINEEDIKRQTAQAKEAGDLVIVNMHWGDETSFTANADQKKYAQLLADCGVDVIIGEHPHVLEPMQWIEGKDGNRTLLTYSIGNFVSTMLYDYYMVGGMLSFDIVKNAEGTHIENPLLTPTVTFYDRNRANLSVYFLKDFTEELCAAHGCNLNSETSLAKLKKYVTDTISSEFLPVF